MDTTYHVLSAHAHNLAQYVGKGRRHCSARGMCSIPRAHAQGVKQSVCPSVVVVVVGAHAQGVKQSVCPSVVVVVVGMKIARSRVLGVCACCKHNQSVDIGEKLVCTRFEFLRTAY